MSSSIFGALLLLLLPAAAVGNEFFSVAAGTHTSFFVDKGVAYAIGRNQYGQLGLGDTENRSTPVQVPLDIHADDNTTFVHSVAAGTYHTLFLTNGGDVFATGRNHYGQLGDGTKNTPSAVKKLTTIEGVAEIAAGYAHSVFRMEDGSVKAVGMNNVGQLGDNSTISKSTPVNVHFGRQGSNDTAVAIAAGYDFTYILDQRGMVWGVGQNLGNQLGVGRSNPKLTAEMCAECGKGGNVMSMAGGESHGLFVSSDVSGSGPGRCMTGSNFAGQLGSEDLNEHVQDLFCASDGTWAAVAGGDSTCLAIPGSQLRCAGDNRFGNLGLGPSAGKFIKSPSEVAAVERSGDVALARTHTLFLNYDKVFTAGTNFYGELGDGSTDNQDTATFLREFERPERPTPAPTPPTPMPAPSPFPSPGDSPSPGPNPSPPSPSPSPDRDTNSSSDWPWEMLVGGIVTGLGVVLVVFCVFDRPGAAEAQASEAELATTA